MTARWLASVPWRQVGSDRLASVAAGRARPGWRDLPLAGRLYVASVIVAGGTTLVVFFPRQIPDPVLFTGLALFAWLTSAWKVTLPLPIVNGSTLSVSYAANLMSLLLLGPSPTLVIAVAAFWIQCTYKPKHPYPLHRTIFSAAAGALTMLVTSVVFTALDGPETPLDSFALARPLVGAIATYFTVNTGLVACAIALSSSASCLGTWRREFLWSGASFMVAGTAGAIAAALLQRGEIWKVVILVAPIYLTYRTYELFAGRLDDEKRHSAEIGRLHQQTMGALDHARRAEQALAAEKERLAVALATMTRLEQARNQLLEREQAARASAEEANRLKDQFLAVVSHELRTPLNAILGWSDMLGKRSLDEELRERAALGIGQSARRQAQLIEDLLDVARITSGKLRLDRSLVDLRATVRDAVEIVQPMAQAKRIEIAVDFDQSCGEVFGDGARLQQIALNLLSNAVKFTLEGGTVRASVRGAGDFVELTVSDTGKGIAPDFLPWVFEPFRQGDAGAARVHAGLGLGLSIVKTLVEAHNGHVSAHSAGEGRGATFTVLLPATTASDRSQTSVRRRQAPAAAAARSDTLLDGLSVLLVDDDDECREVVAAQLQSSRAYVLTASSAAEAMDLLQRRHVDVLLADIGMPEEDGYQLIRRVRAFSSTTASIPAAAITAFAREEDRRAALAAGFQLHLPKPVDAQSLVSAVASLGRMHAV
jgi:signal transduction histidine kinase/ActR/RegA family two-component response regulator